MKSTQKSIVVIGGGPGGYVAAIQAACLGASVILIEKDKLGGTCINRGCIPTKALIESSETYRAVKNAAAFGVHAGDCTIDFTKIAQRKNDVTKKMVAGVGYLMRKNKITVLNGHATIAKGNIVRVEDEKNSELKPDAIIIASGSVPATVNVKGANSGGVMNSDDILELKELPESLAIVGGGVVGLEFAEIFSTLGVKTTVIEMMNQLIPGEDKDVAATLEKIMKKRGVDIRTSTTVEGIRDQSKGCKELTVITAGEKKTIKAARVLIAVGRKPCTDNLGLANIGVKTQNGFIVVDSFLKTDHPSVYAIGDAIGGFMLAHKAMAEGRCAAKNVMGMAEKMDYRAVPRCIWTEPEVAAVGLTQEEATEKHGEINVATFPMTANGKAKILDSTEGFVKIIAEKKYNEIVGVHIVAPAATEMITAASIGIQMEYTCEELTAVIHPHPTVSESMLEAGLLLEANPIHI